MVAKLWVQVLGAGQFHSSASGLTRNCPPALLIALISALVQRLWNRPKLVSFRRCVWGGLSDRLRPHFDISAVVQSGWDLLSSCPKSPQSILSQHYNARIPNKPVVATSPVICGRLRWLSWALMNSQGSSPCISPWNYQVSLHCFLSACPSVICVRDGSEKGCNRITVTCYHWHPVLRTAMQGSCSGEKIHDNLIRTANCFRTGFPLFASQYVDPWWKT